MCKLDWQRIFYYDINHFFVTQAVSKHSAKDMLCCTKAIFALSHRVVSHIHEVRLVPRKELHPSELQQSPWTVLTQGCFVGTQKMQIKDVSVIQLQTISLQDPRTTANITMCFAKS